MLGRLLDAARRHGFRRGPMGSSRAWTGIWVGAALISFLRKRMNKPEAVERFTLHPGETVVISDLGISLRDEELAAKERRRRK